MSVAPLPLSYDDLPPGSDIRRDFADEVEDRDIAGSKARASAGPGTADSAGALHSSETSQRARDRSVYLTVPAAPEPPPAVMKQAMLDALTSSLPLSIVLLIGSYATFAAGMRINRIAGPTVPWAWAFFALFCLALVALVAWVRYGLLADAIRLGREQATVLAATPQRLLIETTGPFGVASYDLAADKVKHLTPARGPLRDDRGTNRRVWHLAIGLVDGRTILILPARDERELRWVSGTIARVLKLTA